MNNESKIPSECLIQASTMTSAEVSTLIQQLMKDFGIDLVLATTVCGVLISTVTDQIKVDKLAQSKIRHIIVNLQSSNSDTNN